MCELQLLLTVDTAVFLFRVLIAGVWNLDREELLNEHFHAPAINALQKVRSIVSRLKLRHYMAKASGVWSEFRKKLQSITLGRRRSIKRAKEW